MRDRRRQCSGSSGKTLSLSSFLHSAAAVARVLDEREVSLPTSSSIKRNFCRSSCKFVWRAFSGFPNIVLIVLFVHISRNLSTTKVFSYGFSSLALRLTFLKFSLVIGVPGVFVNDIGSIIVRLSNASIVGSIKHIFNFFSNFKISQDIARRFNSNFRFSY